MGNKNERNYDDIINLPHFVSNKHAHMSMSARAAQFAPFAALNGHEEAVEETARLTDEKLILGEEQLKTINEKLAILKEHIDDGLQITVEHFVPDSRKSGGKYIKSVGVLHRIDDYDKSIMLSPDKSIMISDVWDIDCDIFASYFDDIP